MRFDQQIVGYQTKHERRRRWYKIVSALACIVVFCTTYALILPALTMETPRVLECPLVVHEHTADCYDAEGGLICGQADFVVHTHDEDCYDEDGNLVCALPEIEAHEHTEACYTEEAVLICGERETNGHRHDDSCYIVEETETAADSAAEPHVHTDACYMQTEVLHCGERESEGHRHDDGCYTVELGALCCGREEHAHDESCYDELGELLCTRETHEHTNACYEQTAVLACGMEEGEGAHIHDSGCYDTAHMLICELAEDGDASEPEKTLICELEEGEGAHIHDDGCYEWQMVRSCGKEEVILHEHDDDCYEPVYDDVYNEETGEWEWQIVDYKLICGKLEVLEHVHDADDCFIYVEELPENEPMVYSYTDDTIEVEVTLAAESAVPAGATLSVQPITGVSPFSEDGEDETESEYDYEELVRQAEEAVDQTVAEILLYDISFYTPDGEYLPVTDAATVSLRFREAVLSEAAGEIAVLHYTGDEELPVALESVDVERDEDETLSALTFQTEGFSVFALVTTVVNAPDVTKLDGQSYIIASKLGKHAMMAQASTTSGQLAYKGTFDEASQWLFTATGTGTNTYYISCGGQYLSMSNSGELTLVEEVEEDNATVFTVSLCDDNSHVLIQATNGKYINSFGGVNKITGFAGWGQDDDGSQLQLYQVEKQELELDGKSFAIVNQASGDNALTAKSMTVNNVSALTAQSVTVTQNDDGTYQTIGDVPVWKFEEQLDGTFYISTTVEGETKYLYLCANPLNDPNDGRGSLTLSDGPQKITVTLLSDGRVTLESGSSNVNLDSNAGGFWCYNGTDNDSSKHILCEVKELEKVPGITPKGTVINLFDYWADNVNEGQPQQNPNGINKDHVLQFTSLGYNEVGDINHWTGSGAGVLQGIVSNTLGADGYPTVTGALQNGNTITESLAYLFNPDSTTANRDAHRNVGGLLQEDTSGYYYYDSTKNYAYFDKDVNNFTLYKDPAVTYNGSDPGMFFPFDDYPADQNHSAGADGGLNHYFGMTLTTRFVHRYGGHTNSSRNAATTFEFSGDDDVWIFIDDVLVADLGGIHDKAGVTIDFAEGTVTISKVYQKGSDVVTHFSDIFDENVLDDENKTFVDNSYHVLKFFYLERGGNASNLSLKYNLASYPPTGINKVNQYGEKVSGAQFSVYMANEAYAITEQTPVYTGTTDSSGQMLFVDKDGMPYTLAELKSKFGDYFVLKETKAPEGYRLVNDAIQLRIKDNVLLCSNTYESGVWADPNLQISAPNTIQLVDGTTKNVVNGNDENGRIFAVVLKYIGSDAGSASDANLKDRKNWAPVYGTAEEGFTIFKVNGDTDADFVKAAIYAAKQYTESDNVFSLSSSGALQGGLEGLPGDITNYYYMLGDKSKTQYTIAYYWTSVNNDKLEGADSTNTYRIDADAKGYNFDRVFGATINVPNLTNRMFVQKFDEDGTTLVNGATFALYSVQEGDGKIRYKTTDDKYVELVDGAYTINPTTGEIKAGTYTILPAKDATSNPQSLITTTKDGRNISEAHPSGENGTGDFKSVENGTYYLREIAAPPGYEINNTEVMVLVTNDAIYANAGTENDGVTVARGPGYIVATLDQFASEGDIDNTLSWVYEMMRLSGESSSFDAYENDAYKNWGYQTEARSHVTTNDDSSALKTYLEYNTNEGANTLFNYTINEKRYDGYSAEQINALTRRLYTDVGWSYYELYQDTDYGKIASKGANYQDLTGKEIANLFSRSVYVQVTDKKSVGNLEISKTLLPDTSEKFNFTVTLTDSDDRVAKLSGEYSYKIYDISYVESTENDENGKPKLEKKYAPATDESGKEITGTITANDGTLTGTFTLGHNQAVIIENLPYGAGYTITESRTEDGLTGYTVYTKTNGGEEIEGAEVGGTLVWRTREAGDTENICTVEYTNALLPLVKIIKVDSKNPNVTLGNAQFVMYRKETDADGKTIKYYYNNGQWETLAADKTEADYAVTTSHTGELLFANMSKNGDYYLKEIAAPDGYNRLTDEIKITVANGKITSPTTDTNKETADYTVTGTEHEGQQLNMTVKNLPGFELPATGGTGTLPFTIGGALLIAGSLLYGYRLRRRKERRSAR